MNRAMSVDAMLGKVMGVNNGLYRQDREVHSRFIYENKRCYRSGPFVFMSGHIQHQGHDAQCKQSALHTCWHDAGGILGKACSHKI